MTELISVLGVDVYNIVACYLRVDQLLRLKFPLNKAIMEYRLTNPEKCPADKHDHVGATVFFHGVPTSLMQHLEFVFVYPIGLAEYILREALPQLPLYEFERLLTCYNYGTLIDKQRFARILFEHILDHQIDIKLDRIMCAAIELKLEDIVVRILNLSEFRTHPCYPTLMQKYAPQLAVL